MRPVSVRILASLGQAFMLYLIIPQDCVLKSDVFVASVHFDFEFELCG